MSLEALAVLLRVCRLMEDGRRRVDRVDDNDGALCAKEEERRHALLIGQCTVFVTRYFREGR